MLWGFSTTNTNIYTAPQTELTLLPIFRSLSIEFYELIWNQMPLLLKVCLDLDAQKNKQLEENKQNTVRLIENVRRLHCKCPNPRIHNQYVRCIQLTKQPT